MNDKDREPEIHETAYVAPQVKLGDWCKNPLPYLKDNYQYFRDLSLYFDWLTDLKLVDTFQRKNDPYNMLYVFRRRKG